MQLNEIHVLTDKKTDITTDTPFLFENKFAFVNGQGEVFLKKTDLFEDRKIADIDPDSVETQVQNLEKAFDELKSSFNDLFSNIETSKDVDVNELREKLQQKIEEAEKSKAIGDFDTLVSQSKKKLTELMDTISEHSEPDDENKSPEQEESPGTDTPESEGNDTEVIDEPEKTDSKEDVADGDGKDESEDAEKSPANYYRNLAEKAETLMELSDWSHATMEFENLNHLWSEGPDPEGADIKPFREKIDSLREELEEKKRAHYEEQKKIREANLERKKNLLDELKEIIEKEQWTKTKAVARIKGKWDNIRPVPAESQEKLEGTFGKLLQTFDEHKVDRLVKQKQQEEDNLTGKLVILEKMDSFLGGIDADSKNWNELDKTFSELTKQFRKIGRVPSEKNQDVWDRFHTAQDTFHSLRFKHDKKYRKDIEKYLSKKKKLIDEAEALIDSDNLPKAARKVNKLHRQWKKAGNLPQKEENELWDRFKAATDAFNEKKSDNIDVLREQEDKNYETKLGIVEQANEIKDSEEWDATHKQLQQLMDQWKKVGPVPRRKSSKIWKKFKGAMDHFYDRRREFYKEVKEERKDNLKEKEDVLEKLKELTKHENPIEAVEHAKPLQEEFKKAGYVPIKHKNRMWKEYREICDVIYDRFRAAKSAAQIVGKENVENYSADDISEIKNKQDKAGKLRNQIKSLTSDLIQMKESLSYFKPSKGGSPLLDEVKEKIDKAEAGINKKEEELQDLEVEIDKIIRDS